jgi:hypothetical protein
VLASTLEAIKKGIKVGEGKKEKVEELKKVKEKEGKHEVRVMTGRLEVVRSRGWKQQQKRQEKQY